MDISNIDLSQTKSTKDQSPDYSSRNFKLKREYFHSEFEETKKENFLGNPFLL